MTSQYVINHGRPGDISAMEKPNTFQRKWEEQGNKYTPYYSLSVVINLLIHFCHVYILCLTLLSFIGK